MTAAEIDLLAILFAPEPPKPPEPKVIPFVKRYFYRCADCLSVVALETKLPEERSRYYGDLRPTARCGACDGRMEFMGATEKAHHSYLSREVGARPVCDGKCISALGPNCDCECGGANHGSGRCVPVIENQGIPIVQVTKEAAAKGAEYRALVAEFMAAWERKYRGVTNAKRAGEYLQGGDYSLYADGGYRLKDLSKAKSMRSHAGRNKRLRALIADLTGGSR